MSSKTWNPYDVMCAVSSTLWHVHADARGCTALSMSTKPITYEQAVESFLIPMQHRERDADGRWVQVTTYPTREEAERKASLLFAGAVPRTEQEAA